MASTGSSGGAREVAAGRAGVVHADRTAAHSAGRAGTSGRHAIPRRTQPREAEWRACACLMLLILLGITGAALAFVALLKLLS